MGPMLGYPELKHHVFKDLSDFWEGLNSEQMSKRWLDCFHAKFHANKQPHGSGLSAS